MSLPSREELAEILKPDLYAADKHQHGWACKVCVIKQADALLARLRPAWERMEHELTKVRARHVANFENSVDVAAGWYDKAQALQAERDALRADLHRAQQDRDAYFDEIVLLNTERSESWVRIGALRDDLKACAEALEKYGGHLDGCLDNPCTCGVQRELAP